VQAHLDGWDLRIAHDGRLTRWAPGRLLAPHEHGIWARPNPASSRRLEFLVDVVDGQWMYRRNPAVRLPLIAGSTDGDGWWACQDLYLGPHPERRIPGVTLRGVRG
jgi:hypothetical protein